MKSSPAYKLISIEVSEINTKMMNTFTGIKAKNNINKSIPV